jgi:hypothetical protein
LKERLFGLTNSEGNHGDDVTYYLDSSPTHSFMKYLYKYPQAAYPYDLIVKTNRERSRKGKEYELIDTLVFDDDRYFDVFVDFAKSSPEDKPSASRVGFGELAEKILICHSERSLRSGNLLFPGVWRKVDSSLRSG